MASKSNTLKSSKDLGRVAKTTKTTSKSSTGGKKQITESSIVSKTKTANSLPVKYSEKSRLKKDPDFGALSLEKLKIRFKLEKFEVKEAIEDDLTTKDTSEDILCYASHLKFGLEFPVPSTIARLSAIWKVPIRQMHLSWFFCFTRAKRISEVYGVRYGVYEIYHSCNVKRGKNDFHLSPSFKRKYALTGFPTNYEDWDSRPLRIKGTLVNPQFPLDPLDQLALKRPDAETVRNLNYIFDSRRDKRLFDVHYTDEIVEYIYQNDPYKTLPFVTDEEVLEDEVVEDTQETKYNLDPTSDRDEETQMLTTKAISLDVSNSDDIYVSETDNSHVISAIPVSVAQDLPTLLALNEATTENDKKRIREEEIGETRRVQVRPNEADPDIVTHSMDELVQGLGVILAKAKDLRNITVMKVEAEPLKDSIDEDKRIIKEFELQLESKDEEIKQLKALLEREKTEVAQRDSRMQCKKGKERGQRLAAEDECSRLSKIIASLENDLGVHVVKNSAHVADYAHIKEKLEYTTQQYRQLYNGVKERMEIPNYFPEPPEEVLKACI
ncbi:hypothetical protein ACHQM5_002506 [Ranunculus cassubicifolius]